MVAPQWVKAVERPHPPLFADILFLGHQRPIVRNTTGLDCSFRNLMKVRDELLIDQAEMVRCTDLVNQEVAKNGLGYYREYAAKCYAHVDSALANCVAAARLPTRASPRQILRAVEVFTSEVIAFAPYLLVTIGVQSTLQSRLNEVITRARSRNPGLDEVALTASVVRPARKTLVERANEAECSIGLMIGGRPGLLDRLRDTPEGDAFAVLRRHDPALARSVRGYVEEFGWTSVNYFLGAPDDEERVIRRVLDLPPEAPRELRDGTRGGSDWRVLSEHYFPEADRELLDIIREFVFLRSFRLELFFRCHFVLRDIWPSAAINMGLAPHELVYLTHSEILRRLRGEIDTDLSLIARSRMEGYCMSMRDGEPVIKPAPTVSLDAGGGPTLVTGDVAYPGRLRGIARIVRVPEDAAGVGGGHIVIATMTTPAFGPSLRRVGGIVTDEGGLLCHAAVIAREDHVPCLVGTRTATKAFHNGDLVDIHADRNDSSANAVEWQAGVRRQSPVLWRYFSTLGHSSPYMRSALDLPGLDTCKNVDHQTYLAVDEYARLRAALEDRIGGNDHYYAEVATRCYERSEELIHTAVRVSQESPAVTSRADLERLFRDYHDATLGVIPFRYGILILDELLTSTLRDALARHHVLESESDQVIQAMLAGSRPSFESRYDRAIRTLCQSMTERHPAIADPDIVAVRDLILNDSALAAVAEDIRAKYEWLRTSYFTGDGLTMDAILHDVAAALLPDPAGGPSADSAATDMSGSPRVPRVIELSEAERELFDVARQYVHLRSYRMSVCYQADYIVRPLLTRMADELCIDYLSLIQLTGTELIEAIESPQAVVPHEELAARAETFGLYLANDTLWVDSSSRDEPPAPTADGDGGGPGSLIEGQSVYPGTVSGPVCLVFGKNDLSKLRPGDIIVSPMTTNDLTVAIRRNCSGIITDEGGTMSHAAIISRESRIPCIVGTGDATRRLRDGDVVELDAELGVVRIVARS